MIIQKSKKESESYRVKRALFFAMLDLLEKKSLPEIKVTDLAKKACVSRSSFYRKFQTKENVLRFYMFQAIDEYSKVHRYDTGYFASYDNILFSLNFIKEYNTEIRRMLNAGLDALLLETFNEFHEILVGDMLQNDPERYQIYLYIGGIFNVSAVWLREGMSESIEELAEVIAKYFSTHRI